MKNAFFTGLLVVSGSSALAEGNFLHCVVKGKNPHSIVRVAAAQVGQEVVVNATVLDAKGTEKVLPAFKSKASIGGEFQIAGDFYNGPFGIKQVYLIKSGEKGAAYRLESRTYCNFYYQEERCLDGDIIERSSTSDVECKN